MAYVQTQLLLNKLLEQQLQQNGYVVLPQLDEEVVEQLRSVFSQHFFVNHNERSNFNAVSTADNNNSVANKTTAILASTFDSIFYNYRNNGATFFTKELHHGELFAHQDATLIDTSKYIACYCWIPLQDVNVENGCMYIIEKSHRMFKNLISFTYKNDGIPYEQLDKKYVKVIAMKAGEMLLFHPRVFHGSFTNQSQVNRIALNTLISPKDAPLVYYQKKDEQTASEYFVSELSYRNSYEKFSVGLLPEGAIFSRDIPYQHTHIDAQLINKTLQNASKPNSWLKTVLCNPFNGVKRLFNK